MIHLSLILLLLLNLSTCIPSFALVQVKTQTTLKGHSQEQVKRFLATPCNWPNIVASSWSVKGDSVNVPLKPQSQVKEIFGLPPILPLGVSWTCAQSTDGTLDVVSKQGVPGVACDCQMLFEIQEMNRDETSVELTMEYEPVNVLGTFAIPILTIDDALALKVLLPYRLQQMNATPLVKFQQLMGILYGIAGVAHFVDLVFGDSQILKLSGCSPFGELPWSGQALALIWCAAGPIAFVSSRIAGLENAGSLIGYGLMEVFCAALVSSTTTMISMSALWNALSIQTVVAVSYVYSSRKNLNEIYQR
jgi:hypothetical protein